MIPGRFEYHQPESLATAVSMLSDLGEDARVIAGGHSLIPMMKLRLAMPEHWSICALSILLSTLLWQMVWFVLAQ